jgi:hypothetical protein
MNFPLPHRGICFAGRDSTFGKTNTISDQRYDALRRSKSSPLMSALGQKQTLQRILLMSALPPKADIGTQPRDVRFVPKADMPATSALR